MEVDEEGGDEATVAAEGGVADVGVGFGFGVAAETVSEDVGSVSSEDSEGYQEQERDPTAVFHCERH